MNERSKQFLIKRPAGGQWRRAPFSVFVAIAVLTGAAAPSGRPPPDAPRYATLKTAPVNARIGPGEDYKALWTFQAKGVPVQIIEETEDWRRVCDPEGGVAWVRARALDARRTVIRMKPTDLPMRRRPADDAKIGAVLAGRATAALAECKRGWCRISVDHASGWVRQGEVWGTVETRQCR